MYINIIQRLYINIIQYHPISSCANISVHRFSKTNINTHQSPAGRSGPIYIYICIYVHIHINVYVCASMCIYIISLSSSPAHTHTYTHVCLPREWPWGHVQGNPLQHPSNSTHTHTHTHTQTHKYSCFPLVELGGEGLEVRAAARAEATHFNYPL